MYDYDYAVEQRAEMRAQTDADRVKELSGRSIVCGCGDLCVYRYCADRAVNAAFLERDHEFLRAFKQHRKAFGTYIEGYTDTLGRDNPFPKLT